MGKGGLGTYVRAVRLKRPMRVLVFPAPDGGRPAATGRVRRARGDTMNEAKLHEFMGKLVVDMGGAAMMANVILGEELGLYRAMADGKPVTPEELAERTGCNARLVREWLSAQAASGYVEHEQGASACPPSRPWRWRTRTRRSTSPAAPWCLPACTSTRTRSSPRCVATVRCRGPIIIRACSPAPSASSGPAIAPTWSANGCRRSKAWCPGSNRAPRSPTSAAAMARRP